MKIRALIIEQKKTPRHLLKQHNASSRASYAEAGAVFVRDMVDARFTNAHAQAAGFTARKGERMAPGSKQFKRSYTGIKFRRFKHTNPLEFSGDTRRGIKVGHSIRPFAKGARVVFPGARRFNSRNPKSQINMAEEFRTITATEAATLGQVYQRAYTQRQNNLPTDTIITRLG